MACTGRALEEPVRTLPAADSVLLNEMASHEVLFDSACGPNEIGSSWTGLGERGNDGDRDFRW